MRPVIAKSLAKYVDLIINLNKEAHISLFSEDTILYRGQANAEWLIAPSISRLARADSVNQMTLLERELIQRAQCTFPKVFRETKYPFDLLASLQHYGIPTRLLDLTRNALIALFFACQEPGTDGEVIAFLSSEIYSNFDPIVNAIADTYRILDTEVDMTAEMFYKTAATQDYFSFYDAKCHHTVGLYCCKEVIEKLKFKYDFGKMEPRFVLPQYVTERQARQQSYFLLFPNEVLHWGDDEDGLGNRIFAISKASPIVAQRIMIPQEAKTTLIDNLYAVGIHSQYLFPDDIDAGCRELTRHFKIRVAAEIQPSHNIFG